MPVQAQAIDALLPQLQCRACGHAGCLPYAAAIAGGESGIDRCPPGGEALLDALATLTGLPRPARPQGPAWPGPRRYRIDPAACIGCTKCLAVCPVDAIVGAPRHLHDILAAECNGCGLCLPPCPVDCIHPEPAPAPTPAVVARWRERHAARLQRLASEIAGGPLLEQVPEDAAERRARVSAAIARARAARDRT
jgi:electron transport complex protein RnfB